MYYCTEEEQKKVPGSEKLYWEVHFAACDSIL